MPISPQQKQIIEKMEEEPSQIYVDKDLSVSLNIKKDTVRSQLGKLEKFGAVTHNDDGFWLTENYQEAIEKANKVKSLAEARLEPRNYFEDLLHRFSVKEEHIPVITDTIWRRDPEDLVWVWEELGRLMVAPDAKKQIVEAWRSYIDQPMPEQLQSQIAKTKTKEELTLEAKQKAAEPKEDKALVRGWILEEEGPHWVGSAGGEFTLEEAKEIFAVRQVGLRRKSEASAGGEGNGQSRQDSVSSILTALAPYVNKDTNTDLLREAVTKQMELQEQRIVGLIPQPGEKKGMADNVQEIIGLFTALQSAGPVLRGILGIPEQTASPPANQSTPQMIQIQNADGTPMTLTLDNFFQIRKFEAEERREEESHKNKQEMVKTSKDFLVKIANAAQRMAQG
jgi:hypothetical protein